MKRVLLLLAAAMVAGGCSGDSGTDAAASSSPLSPPSTAPSLSPSPTKPPKLPLPEARLDGTYTVKLYVTHNSFDSKPSPKQKFRFDPKCAEGACDVTLSGKMLFGQGLEDRQAAGAEKNLLLRLAVIGRNYAGTKVGYFAECSGKPDKDRWTFDIKVDKAKYVDGVWTATRWSGTWTRAANGLNAVCRPGRLKAVIRGTLRS